MDNLLLCAALAHYNPAPLSYPQTEDNVLDEDSMKKTLKFLTLLSVLFSFAHPAVAETDTSYKINAGDILQVTVWKEEGLDQEILVLPDGTINYPLIGSIPAQGETTAQVQVVIKQKLQKLIPDASVTVAVKAALGHTVSVIGQVTKPGELVMGHRLTVMQALSQAGGLTPYASEGSIIILRRDNGKETSIPFPYGDIVSGDNLDKDIVLNPGDVVVVPTAGLL
jgi:polysaccharide export outer membrane protein